MKIKNKKLIVSIIVGGIAVLGMVFGVVVSRGSGNSWSDKTGNSLSTGSKLPGKNIQTKRRAKKTEFTSWKRSPFISQEVIAAPDVKVVLKGVVWHNENPKALLNDEIMGIGEKIGGYTVVEITEDSVLLNDGTKDLRLKMKY